MHCSGGRYQDPWSRGRQGHAGVSVRCGELAHSSWRLAHKYSDGGLGFERESVAAADVDKLVIVSVIRWDDLQELANEIKANGNTTGLYAKE